MGNGALEILVPWFLNYKWIEDCKVLLCKTNYLVQYNCTCTIYMQFFERERERERNIHVHCTIELSLKILIISFTCIHHCRRILASQQSLHISHYLSRIDARYVRGIPGSNTLTPIHQYDGNYRAIPLGLYVLIVISQVIKQGPWKESSCQRVQHGEDVPVYVGGKAVMTMLGSGHHGYHSHGYKGNALTYCTQNITHIFTWNSFHKY